MSPGVLFQLSLLSRVFLQMEGGVLRSPGDQRRAMNWIFSLTNTNDWMGWCVVVKDQMSDTLQDGEAPRCIAESLRALINLYLRLGLEKQAHDMVVKETSPVFSLLMKHFCSLHWKTAAVHTNPRFTVYSHEGTKQQQHRCLLLLVRNNHLTYDYLFTSVWFLH